MRVPRLLALLALLALAAPAEVLAAELRLPLASGGAIVLAVPDSWHARDVPDSDPASIELEPAEGNAFSIQVTPMVKRDGKVAPADLSGLRGFVAAQAEENRTQARETEVPLQRLTSDTVEGFYYSLTDKSETLEPDEYRHLTQGAFIVDGIPVVFTILGNGDSDEISAPALEILRGARKE
jgi:hypothetical protein